MESPKFTRRAFVLTSTVTLVSAAGAQETTSLQRTARAYYDTASARKSIEAQVRSLLGEDIGSYGSLPVAGRLTSSAHRAQASTASQFMQAYEVTTGVYQTQNGNLIVSAHQAHNTDQMAFVLLHGNAINLLAAAILHNNCAKGALAQASGRSASAAQSNPCDDRPTLTIFYPKSRNPDPADLQSFSTVASKRLKRQNIATPSNRKELIVKAFHIEVKRL